MSGADWVKNSVYTFLFDIEFRSVRKQGSKSVGSPWLPWCQQRKGSND